MSLMRNSRLLYRRLMLVGFMVILAFMAQTSLAQNAHMSGIHPPVPVKINSYWIQDGEDLDFSILVPLEFFAQTQAKDGQASDILGEFLLDWLPVSQMNQFCSLRDLEKPRSIDRFQTQIRGTYHCLNNETPISIQDTKVGEIYAAHSLLIRHARATPDTMQNIYLMGGQTEFEFDIGPEGKINARGSSISGLKWGFHIASTNLIYLIISALLVLSLLIRLQSPLKQYLIIGSFLIGHIFITSNAFYWQDISLQTSQIFLGGLILFYCLMDISSRLRIAHWISFTIAGLIFLLGLLPLAFITVIPDGTWAGLILFFIGYGLWTKEHPYSKPELAAFRPTFSLAFGILSALMLIADSKPDWALSDQYAPIEWGLSFGATLIVIGSLMIYKAGEFLTRLPELIRLNPRDKTAKGKAPAPAWGTDALVHNIIAAILATLGSYITLLGVLQ